MSRNYKNFKIVILMSLIKELRKNENNRIRALSNSTFRSKFKLDDNDKKYIEKISLDKIKFHAKDFITRRLAPAFPKNDGKQTPYKGHPVFKAQHATATCCRGCLFKWYKIPKGQKLNALEIEYLVEKIAEWIVNKM